MFGQKFFDSVKSVFFLGKVAVLKVKVVVFGQKWFFSRRVVVFGYKWLYSEKVVVFGQKWL